MKRNSAIRCRTKGFTLAELLITLIVTGIILSAVATLAYALSSASQTGSDVASTQAQLRQGTLRILDLIQNGRMILTATPTELAIWRNDANEDGRINVNELVFLECSAEREALGLTQFSSVDNPEVTFGAGGLSSTKATLVAAHGGTWLPLLPDCTSVQLTPDVAAPSTRRVTISFELTENGIARKYEVSATLRAWAGHLLNDAQDGLVTEDDDE